jgi:hypothetical protein
MRLGTEGVGEAANTMLVTPPLYNAGAAADSTSSSTDMRTEGIAFDSLRDSSSRDVDCSEQSTDAAVGGPVDFSQGLSAMPAAGHSMATAGADSAAEGERVQLSEGVGGGLKVYVGDSHLAAGFDGLPAGTSMEGAVEAANELADEVEADRREDLAGENTRMMRH